MKKYLLSITILLVFLVASLFIASGEIVYFLIVGAYLLTALCFISGALAQSKLGTFTVIVSVLACGILTFLVATSPIAK